MMTPGDRCLLSYSFKDNGHFDEHLVVFHLTISVWLERVVACSTGHVTPSLISTGRHDRDGIPVNETRELLMSRAPADFYRYGDQILRNKALALGCLRRLSLVPRRELDQFIASPLPLVRGCVLLSGASGIGKTCFAEAHGQHPFVIHTLDQCKDIPLECDLLVFEDMRFDVGGLDLKPEEMLSLLTADRETSIKCQHFDGQIPAIPHIFTTNLDPDGGPKAFPSGANAEQQKALDRRATPRGNSASTRPTAPPTRIAGASRPATSS